MSRVGAMIGAISGRDTSVPTLHDADFRSRVVTRLAELKPDSAPRWGTMTADQMLWHVNQALSEAVGEIALPQEQWALPRPILKFAVLNLPWGKNAPTRKAFVATGRYDFDAERARCLRLIGAVAARGLDVAWPLNAAFGRMTGREVSRLHAKHLNHHLTQFGV
jgi:hypothetical protein